jgi:hypothetical protein
MIVMLLPFSPSFGARPKDGGVVDANRRNDRTARSLRCAASSRGNDTACRLLAF